MKRSRSKFLCMLFAILLSLSVIPFAAFAAASPDFKFVAAVARDGSMLDARGIVYAASGEKRDTESSFI